LRVYVVYDDVVRVPRRQSAAVQLERRDRRKVWRMFIRISIRRERELLVPAPPQPPGPFLLGGKHGHCAQVFHVRRALASADGRLDGQQQPGNRPDRVLALDVSNGHAGGDEYDIPHSAVEHGGSSRGAPGRLWFGERHSCTPARREPVRPSSPTGLARGRSPRRGLVQGSTRGGLALPRRRVAASSSRQSRRGLFIVALSTARRASAVCDWRSTRATA